MRAVFLLAGSVNFLPVKVNGRPPASRLRWHVDVVSLTLRKFETLLRKEGQANSLRSALGRQSRDGDLRREISDRVNLFALTESRTLADCRTLPFSIPDGLGDSTNAYCARLWAATSAVRPILTQGSCLVRLDDLASWAGTTCVAHHARRSRPSAWHCDLAAVAGVYRTSLFVWQHYGSCCYWKRHNVFVATIRAGPSFVCKVWYCPHRSTRYGRSVASSDPPRRTLVANVAKPEARTRGRPITIVGQISYKGPAACHGRLRSYDVCTAKNDLNWFSKEGKNRTPRPTCNTVFALARASSSIPIQRSFRICLIASSDCCCFEASGLSHCSECGNIRVLRDNCYAQNVYFCICLGTVYMAALPPVVLI